ncbi:nitric oxide synthase oxygenase [Fodinicola feengrottensis]|uniref:nitric oxide synthase oxygenase n=1 Tax=Fodinicola feengrottensis TaxID=435914 RepID=UPI002441821F|nr:nitric oxide synthase oxygenase [Fodinicola feengrottensis]
MSRRLPRSGDVTELASRDGSELPVGATTYPSALRRGLDEPSLYSVAEEFLQAFHLEQNKTEAVLGERLRGVRRQIAETGGYVHTADELTWGARVAWRNSARCVGRLYWSSLRVRDLRAVQTVDEVFQHCCEHLEASYNGGHIRPMITVFAPREAAEPGVEIISPQLLCYAGYRLKGPGTLGDAKNRGLTAAAVHAGWSPPRQRGRFDVLPLVMRDPHGCSRVRSLPPAVVPEVELSHPDYPWFGELGLRWFGLPVVSDMALYAGGIVYPTAPFSGWFVGTEIGARATSPTARAMTSCRSSPRPCGWTPAAPTPSGRTARPSN